MLNRNFKLISFIGFSESGKTNSILSIINYLTKNTNFKIFVLKNIHIHSLDLKGKDTFQFSDAGANCVITKSNNQTTFFLNYVLNTEEIFDWIEKAPIKPDIIIAEGFRDFKYDKILCAKDFKEVEEQIDETIKVISGLIATKKHKNNDNYKGIPIINALEKPELILKTLCPKFFQAL